MIGEGGWLVLFLVAQRLGELVYAQFNTRRLLARGGVEFGARHYPLIVAVHGLWLGALWLFGHDHDVNRLGLLVFVALQAARLWVLATLGPRWTTRIIVMPGLAPVVGGPYRFLRHPNYAVVVAEIAVVPLALGLPWVALIFSAANAGVLYIRIRAESAALAYALGGEPSLANTGSKR